MGVYTALLLLCSALLTLQSQQYYYGIIVGDDSMSGKTLQDIVEHHDHLDSQVSVKSVKHSYDAVFDFVMKVDMNPSGEISEEMMKEKSGVRSLQTMLEENNGLMIELVMDEAEFDQE